MWNVTSANKVDKHFLFDPLFWITKIKIFLLSGTIHALISCQWTRVSIYLRGSPWGDKSTPRSPSFPLKQPCNRAIWIKMCHWLRSVLKIKWIPMPSCLLLSSASACRFCPTVQVDFLYLAKAKKFVKRIEHDIFRKRTKKKGKSALHLHTQSINLHAIQPLTLFWNTVIIF